MKTTLGLSLGLLLLVASGCGPDFDRFQFQNRNTPPLPVEVRHEQITLPAGIAVGVIATPLEDDGDEMDEETEVRLSSDNTTIVGSDPGIENHTFVFYGVNPGQASLLIEVDGEFFGTIPVTVVRQDTDL